MAMKAFRNTGHHWRCRDVIFNKKAKKEDFTGHFPDRRHIPGPRNGVTTMSDRYRGSNPTRELSALFLSFFRAGFDARRRNP